MTENALLGIAACLEAPSEHPLGAAIVEEAAARQLPKQPVEGFEAVHGRGVRAELAGRACLAGNRAMMEEAGIGLDAWLPQAEALANQGKTPLYFARGETLLGVIAVADTPKATSKDAVAAFRSLGIDVIMLTGEIGRASCRERV